jgi:hypothetical protein
MGGNEENKKTILKIKHCHLKVVGSEADLAELLPSCNVFKVLSPLPPGNPSPYADTPMHHISLPASPLHSRIGDDRRLEAHLAAMPVR